MTVSYLDKILGSDATSGFILIANSLLIGFVLYYAINFLLSHITYTQAEHPLKFIFKIIFLGILLNCSYFLCETILSLNSTLSLAIREIGENLFGKNICFASLIQELNKYLYLSTNEFTIFSFDGIIKGFISFGLLNLLFSYSLRYVMIMVFILISPIAILSLSVQKTSWFFQSWFKIFLSLLFIQILISIILVITFSIGLNQNSLLNSLLYVGCIYALMKSNSFLQEFMGGISTNVQANISNIKSFFN